MCCLDSVLFHPPLPDGWEDGIEHYPDNTYSELKRVAGRFFGVPSECVIPGNGSSELIRLFAEVVYEKGDVAIIVAPTFEEYEFSCRMFGANVRRFSYWRLLQGEFPDVSGVKALYVCNPNNPTGSLIKRESILKFIELCLENDTFLFLDEVFIELSEPDESVSSCVVEYPNLFIIRSLTKAFGIPGIRVGFGLANPEIAPLIERCRLVWNLGSLQTKVAIHFLSNGYEHLERARELIKVEREYLTQKLKELGLNPYPSDVNFILVDLGGIKASRLTEEMEKEGVLVRDCTSFALPNHIRVAVRRREENE